MKRLLGAPVVLTAFLIGALAHADDSVTKAPAPATAETPPGPWLLGDWGGARTRWRDRGVDFQFGYTNELAYNAAGGIDNKARYADQYTAGMTLDLQKLIGIPSAQFQVTLTERTGRDLVEDAELGTLQLVQEVFGRGQTIRLTQFWYQQKFLGGLIDWKVGRMTVGEDFASFSCDFQNLTFCGSDPGNIVGDYIFNWPISQWATRVKLNLNDFGYFEVGAYDVNPRYLGVQDQVLPVWFSDSTGVLIPVELAWLPKFGDGALPGSYKIGAWYDTSTADDAVDDINGDPFALTGLPAAERRGRYGGYINFQQQVTDNVYPVPERRDGGSTHGEGRSPDSGRADLHRTVQRAARRRCRLRRRHDAYQRPRRGCRGPGLRVCLRDVLHVPADAWTAVPSEFAVCASPRRHQRERRCFRPRVEVLRDFLSHTLQSRRCGRGSPGPRSLHAPAALPARRRKTKPFTAIRGEPGLRNAGRGSTPAQRSGVTSEVRRWSG